ncbi:MAG: DNA translocase FtsK [Candidatus Eremiobacteraeota bacterium]|nr:DNA translocase FtsK [Candidatus Eremiobacteraeota bacterium]
MKRTKAARSRRVDPLPGLALNLEIIGIGLLCVALLLALALLVPGRSGSFGPVASAILHGGFGAGAWLAIVALVVVALIVFLELHALFKLAFFAACAAGEFIVLDAWLGLSNRGGLVGNALAHGVMWLLGPIGAAIVLAAAAVALVLAPTGASLKVMLGVAARRALRASHGAIALASAIKERSASPAQADPPARATAHTIPRSVEPADAAPAVVLAPLATIKPEQLQRMEPELFDQPPAVVANGSTTSPIRHPIAIETPEGLPQRPPEPRAKTDRVAGEVEYRLPDYALFNPPEKRVHNETSAALILEETLASFGVEGKVTHIERGPSVTRYEMTPGKGVKVSAIKSLSDNIQLVLAAQSVRIEAPIPGKAAVGIEVPNSAVAVVSVREILDYVPRGEGKLFFGLGKDITGRPIVGDLTRMPHLLVAGATGAGKSVCLNVILASLLSTCTPDQVQLLLIDPKRVELTSYNGIPHLIKDCITDPKLAAGALYELTKEMDARYERFARAGVRKIEEYNVEFPFDRLPYIVVVIDELADLMLVAPTRVETSICRIAQLARATGIHLIVATQRPSVDVITGLIKANIPSRISFAVSSQVDSRTIIDMAGAERLLGRGDMLYLPIDSPKPIRVQGALVTGAELERLCEFWRAQEEPDNRIDIELSEVEEDGRGPADELAFEAAQIIIERQMASVALLQAELKVGHPRAVRLMKILEDFRVVGPAEGTKPRKIFVGAADLDALATTLAPRRREQPLL